MSKKEVIDDIKETAMLIIMVAAFGIAVMDDTPFWVNVISTVLFFVGVDYRYLRITKWAEITAKRERGLK